MKIVKVGTSEIEQQYGYNDLTAVATYSSLPSFYIKLQGTITEFVIKKYFDETFIKEIPLDEGDIASDGTFLYFPTTSVDTELASLMGSGGQYQYSFKVDGQEYKSNFRFAFKGIIFPRNIIFSTVVVDDVGGGNGSITVNAQGGYPPLTYSKDGGSTYQSSNIFSGLTAGDYPIKVKDSKGFESYTTSVTVGGVAVPVSFTFITTEDTGSSDGTITITASGGVPPYEYSKDNGSTWQGSNVFTGLSYGNYTLKVRDSELTESAPQVANVGTLPVSFTFTKQDDSGSGNGSITITASGGIPSYEYSKDNGSTWQFSNIFTGLTPATYSVIVRDSLLTNSPAQNIEIVLDLAVITIDSLFKRNESALGAGDGFLRITASKTGVATLEYSIDDISYQSSNEFNNTPNGSQTAYVRDAGNITNKVSESFNILAFPASTDLKFTTNIPDILPDPGAGSRLTDQWYWSVISTSGNTTVTELVGNGVKIFTPQEGVAEVELGKLNYNSSTNTEIGKRYVIIVTHAAADTKTGGLAISIPGTIYISEAITGSGAVTKYFVNEEYTSVDPFNIEISLRGTTDRDTFIDITNVEIREYV